MLTRTLLASASCGRRRAAAHWPQRRPSTPTAAAPSRTASRSSARRASARTRSAARNGFVLEVDAKLTEDGVPVAIHDATLDRTTNCSGEVRTFTLAELGACRIDVLGSPGSPLRTRVAARPVALATIAEVLKFARRTGAKVNLEIKNVPSDPDFDSTPAYANRVMDVVLAQPHPALAAADPELHRREPGRGAAAHAGSDHEPAVDPGDQRALPPDRGRQRLRLHLARVAGERRLREPRARPSGSTWRRSRSTRPRTCALRERQGGGPDHRRPADGGPRARPAPASVLRCRSVLRRAPAGRHWRHAPAQGRVGQTGVSRQDHHAGDDPKPPGAKRSRAGDRDCEFRFGTGRTPKRLGPPLVTILFEGNSDLLPSLDGPELAGLKPPEFTP